MSHKLNVAIVGYGNIGRYALKALQSAPDMELTGVVRRQSQAAQPEELAGIKVVNDIGELPGTQAALLCVPTLKAPEYAVSLLQQGICTVDSYDIHGTLADVRKQLDPVAKAGGAVAIISAGWDPGTDSLFRAMFEFMAPRGITYTNFGPGMSMGHTVAVKAIAGVKKALSMTIPAGMGVHRRAVYIELEPGAEFAVVENAIKTDPYFVKDDTRVIQVNSVDDLLDMGHGVLMERKGASSGTDNQLLKLDMRINNPALTAQIMVAAIRAASRQQPGCYTMLEVPVIDFLPGDKEELIRRLV
jgi:diaminopimelate dehydrogenase